MITVRVPGPGTITARQSRASAADGTGKHLVKRILKVARQAGPVRLAIRPTSAATKVLQRQFKLTVRLRITFEPTGGSSNSRVEKVTIERRKP